MANATFRPDSYPVLARRASRLATFSVGYNALEAVVAIASGLLAGSIALVGFGLDSVIEVTSALTILWRFRSARQEQERAESRAVKLVGATFFALAAYVTYEAITDLWLRRTPAFSIPGLVIAVLSLIIMPILGLAKRRLAIKLASRALAADATETLLCSYLSATLLLGVAANGWLGWWWADPIAALCMVPYMIWEGLEAFEEKSSG
jgi:divalent metal cation (Fe/Co/Zn/Cd) transporter